MKRIISLAAALATSAVLAVMATAQDDAYYTRLDYLDEQGHRLWSNYAGEYGLRFDIDEPEEGGLQCKVWDSSVATYKTVSTIKFVNYGEEANKFTLTADWDVEAWYEIDPGKGHASQNTYPAGSEPQDVLCGKTVRVWMKMQPDRYPIIRYTEPYVRGSYDEDGIYDGQWAYISGFAPYYFQNVRGVPFDFDLRKTYREYLNAKVNDIFVRSNENPNLWYCDIEMSNGPLILKAASLQSPNGDMLRGLTLRALHDTNRPDMGGFYSGEYFVMTCVGDFLGQDLIPTMWCQGTLNYFDRLLQPKSTTYAGYYHVLYPWRLCYNYISHANLVLDALPLMTAASQRDIDIARAQMLTLRSHAYWRILQMYAPRWSEGPDTPVAPLETYFNDTPLPPATMRQIMTRCYDDLDEAISLFDKHGYVRGLIMEPDAMVARATKMRMALLREDWVEIVRLSAAIMQDPAFKLANFHTCNLADQFCQPNSTWIWGATSGSVIYENEDCQINTFMWEGGSHLFNACNGYYPPYYSYSPYPIDIDLYDKILPNDIRKKFFVMPESLEGIKQTALLKRENWYSSKYMDTISLYHNVINNRYEKFIVNYFRDKSPEGYYPPFTNQDKDWEDWQTSIAMGAQVKFMQKGSWSDSNSVAFLRSEEVLLSHAEACAMLKRYDEAAADLDRLNALRMTDPEPTPASASVLEAVRLARRIELWGEGHSWFDFKRWKLPIVRRKHVLNDPTSGNWPDNVPERVEVTEGNGWRLIVPSSATKSNPLLDPAAMGYREISTEPITAAPRRYAPSQNIGMPNIMMPNNMTLLSPDDTHSCVVPLPKQSGNSCLNLGFPSRVRGKDVCR